MTREELIRHHFDRSMKLIEIGPSYNPIIAKADGWQTTTIDHASRDELLQKYSGLDVDTLDRIEPVDLIWRDGPLTDLFPQETLGTFDGFIASHVGEHLPDLIGFLNAVASLLKPDGVLALALPDKRVCFDFFQPLTATSDLIEAHRKGRTRHPKKAFFNQAAYLTFRGDSVAWARNAKGAFRLAHSIEAAQQAYDNASEDSAMPYEDTHGWTFTPSSFSLMMLELNLLGYTDWAIRSIQEAEGVEFFAWLERRKLSMSTEEANAARLSLMANVVLENKQAIAQLDDTESAPSSWPAPRPSIAAIIPMYNGATYIEEALMSVFRQTVPPDEIIVVNDGSTDGGAGAAIVECLAKTHNVTLLHKENGGQSSARNFGVRAAKSELIALLDQDDVWYDNHLEELAKPFQRRSVPPLGWVYSNLDEIDERGCLMARSYLSSLKAAHPKRHIYECIREDMFILPSASLINRKAFEAVGGFDERLCGYEDDDLFMRMFRDGYDNSYLNMPLSKWRIYPTSTSYSPRMARSRAIYTRKLFDLFPDDPKRMRYYVRDLIMPRFVEHAVREYWEAERSGDQAAMDEAWAELQFLAGYDKNLTGHLYNQALRKYRAALMNGSDAEIANAWKTVSDILAAMPGRHIRARAMIALLRNPRVSKAAFGIRQWARPAMIWGFQS